MNSQFQTSPFAQDGGTLGTLHYGASRTSIRMDDRVLAHLQVVITTKLRRSEGFLIQWERPAEKGSGRGGFWIHPNCDLTYEYEGNREPALDHEELDRMMISASATGGVKITGEQRSWNLGEARDDERVKVA
jgi:hypothetical protein